MATQKFRPVLTVSQLQNIAALCTENDSPESKDILKVIIPLLAKINVGAITPSYIVTPESEKIRIDRELRAKYNDGLMTPEEESEYEAKIMGI